MAEVCGWPKNLIIQSTARLMRIGFVSYIAANALRYRHFARGVGAKTHPKPRIITRVAAYDARLRLVRRKGLCKTSTRTLKARSRPGWPLTW